MQRRKLGRTGLDVPVVAVGTAPIAALPIPEGGRLLHRAYELGAIWWDTSEDYGSYPHVAAALHGLPRDRVIISTKTNGSSREDGLASIDAALREFNTDHLEIFFLHYVTSIEQYHERQGCLEALIDARQQGKIKAVGVSSHQSDVIKLAASDKQVDVVLAPWNMRGQLPEGGNLFAMEHAIRACYDAGKGVVLMKVLAAGALRPIFDDAIRNAVRFPAKHALNIGVKSIHELEADIRLVLGQPVDAAVIKHLRATAEWGRAA